MLFSKLRNTLVFLLPLLVHALPFDKDNSTIEQVLPRAYRDENWNTCYDRGVRVYNALQAALRDRNHRDDTTGPARKAFYTTTVTNGQQVPVSANFDRLAQNLRLPLDMYRYIRTYKWALFKDPIFENMFNAQAGVIIAKENKRYVDKNDPPNQRLDWQEEAYLGYSEMATGQHVPVSGLNYILQYNILNQPTQEVIDDVYEHARVANPAPGTWTSWNIEQQPEIFYALLGTPNAQGAAKLLTAHATAFGYKTITTIYTNPNGPHMAIRLRRGRA